jgi:hypothetical protein
MVRLRDAQQALIADLPPGFLRRAHWLKAGKALVTAAETGKPKDIEWAFESIVAALDEEGWLPQGVSRVPPPRSVVSSNDRVSVGNITPRPPVEPLWRRRAFEAVVAALDEEGWLPQGASREPPRSGLPRFEPPRFDPLRFQSLRRVRPSVAVSPQGDQPSRCGGASAPTVIALFKSGKPSLVRSSPAAMEQFARLPKPRIP